MSRAWVFPVMVAGIAAFAIAVVGATITHPGPWYHGLVQPRWAPPDAAYAAAWTGIYALTALAGVTAWLAIPGQREGEWLIGLFALNGFLNILWSLLFFRLERPDWAMVEAIALWLSVAALIVFVWRRSMPAAVLLLPYLMWVTFAGYLTMTIVRLNGPFSLTGATEWLFARGHAADLVLAVMGIELVWLVRARGWPIGTAVARLLPGSLMILALRVALIGAAWPWIAVALACSFPAHLADLMLGAPRRRRSPTGSRPINSPSDTRSHRRASADR